MKERGSQVAERLGNEPGTEVWARKRTTMIDGRPNQLPFDLSEITKVQVKLGLSWALNGRAPSPQ